MYRLLLKQTIFFLLMGTVVLFCADHVKALERFGIVSTLELEELLKQRRLGTVDFILVNSLDEIIFRDSHIPGSVNIPLARLDQQISKLGSDREKLIIPY